MKKTLLTILSIISLSMAINAQSYMEGFNANTVPAGWDTLNNSAPKGTAPSWLPSTSFTAAPVANEGTQFFVSNFQTTAGTGVISTWLMSPVRNLQNGDMLSFYTRTLGDGTYADRMEVRLSTAGTSSNVGATSTSVGDYCVTLGTINAALTASVYPLSWTKFNYTLSGLPGGGVSGRLAFRYFVTNGGPTGANSDAVAVDSVYYKVVVTTGVKNLDNNSFKIYPNPAKDVVSLNFTAVSNDREVIVQNMLGDAVLRQNVTALNNTINVAELAKGVYFINVREGNSYTTEKLTIQ